MCIGSHLANREIYTIFTRLILSFTFHPPADLVDAPLLDALECNAVKTAMALQPKPFKVRVKPRNSETLERWIEESEGRTVDCL
jgi:phenylacetate 2-hydroxylase